MLNRAISISIQFLLLVAAIAVLVRVYDFGQERFFTVDEYQFGHATWLVGRGDELYVDFFEHHFSLSYVPHAVFFSGDPDAEVFSIRALRFRKIVLAYILAASLFAALTSRVTTRDPHEALLAGFLPLIFGFGLMSAIDYRADSQRGARFPLRCLSNRTPTCRNW
jgi:hypothetical protein